MGLLADEDRKNLLLLAEELLGYTCGGAETVEDNCDPGGEVNADGRGGLDDNTEHFGGF